MLSTQFCPTCGAANEAAQTHCFACGHTLTTSTNAPATPDAPLLHERYRPGAVLGSGGFSTVYRAHDMQAKREVAIKRINLHGLSAEKAIEATDTFNREVSVLSSLQHPQIPQIYDQFSDQDHWYLVLQYLEGPTLETYLETRTAQGKPLQFDEVLEMALQLGEVLNYLHTCQPPVIFRDLKPSNIIRTLPKGTLCLVDFGIARRFRAGQKRDTHALGSLGYAAPEQYGRAQTTPRSDIYSLGVLLHFLLSGDDPAEEASPGLKPLLLHIEPGMEAVSDLVQRMLSPDPERRPASMSEVIAVLERVRQQRAAQPTMHVWQPPIPQGLPPSAGWQQAQVQAPLFPPLPPAQIPASRQRGLSRRKVLLGLGGVLAAVGIGEGVWWANSLLPFPLECMYTYSGNGSIVNSVAWSPNGKYIAASTIDNTVQVWEATTGKTLLTYGEYIDTVDTTMDTIHVNSIAWAPNSKYIVSASKDNTVQVWEAITGKTLLTYRGHTDIVNSVAWSPDGQYIVSSSKDNTVQAWEATSGKTLSTYRKHTDVVYSVAWSLNSQYIVSGSLDNTAQVWKATSGKTVLTYRGHTNYVYSVAWSPNGLYIVSSSRDGTAQIWEATTGKTVLTYQAPAYADEVTIVAWSPNGKYIISGFDYSSPAQIWDATNGKVVLTYQENEVEYFAWSPDSERIAFGFYDGTTQVWNAP